MSYTRNIFVILIAVFFAFVCNAQEEPKYELRSTFLTTVWNIDWPKSATRNQPDLQKAELQRMFDVYKETNMNAVFFQVRTECDALYHSSYEPWSRFLTSAQGDDPGYDPLAFALEEAHKRGLELHVWLNPYRINASTEDVGDYYHSTHIYKEHPEWAIEYESGKKILNPGRPEVMAYIASVVEDLISNYPVDGVHFDDYFYSYDGTPSNLDATEYEQYGNGMTLGDWRRDNVNQMIDTVYNIIQSVNPNIRFGVSPFGIYKNGVPSGISGFNAYTTIYCDPLAWLENGSVDYLTPQLYWPTGGNQDFEKLANWWADQCFTYNRHLYTGHGTYRFDSNPDLKSADKTKVHETKYYFEADFMNSQNRNNLSKLELKSLETNAAADPWTLSQLGTQIDIVRLNQNKNGLGNVFFSASDLDRVNGLTEYLINNKYTHLTILPPLSWKADDTPAKPENIHVESSTKGDILIWNHSGGYNVRYAVYITSELIDSSQVILNQNNLTNITFDKQILFSELDFSKGINIVVTAVSATGRESMPSSVFTLDVNWPMVELVSPANNDTIERADTLVWSCNKNNAEFLIQISTNSNFGTIVYQSDWQTDSSLVIDEIELAGEKKYFWRVRAKIDSEGSFSGSRTFITGFPENPEILAPQNLVSNISTNPKIEWETSTVSDEIEVLISTSSSFNNVVAEETFEASLGEGILETELEEDTWYYLKIRASNSFGKSLYSELNTFQTSSGPIPDVSIVSPENGTTVASFDSLKWKTTTTEGTITFMIDISYNENFNDILTSSGWISETELQVSKFNIDGDKTYYWRVKAKSEFGESYYTNAGNFRTGYPTRPLITEPAHLASDVPVNPTISWTNDENTDSIYVEFSLYSGFSTIEAREKFLASDNSSTLSSSLQGNKWYYIHISADNEYGSSIFSKFKYFETGNGTGISDYNNDDLELLIYPNKVTNGKFNLRFFLQEQSSVTIEAFDAIGNKIARLHTGKQTFNGLTEFSFNTFELGNSGLYFIKVRYNNGVETKPILVTH